MPQDLPASLAEGASRSIGETLLAANALGGPAGQVLAAAGRDAFSASHSIVLLAAAAIIGALSIVVCIVLRAYREPDNELTH